MKNIFILTLVIMINLLGTEMVSSNTNAKQVKYQKTDLKLEDCSYFDDVSGNC